MCAFRTLRVPFACGSPGQIGKGPRLGSNYGLVGTDQGKLTKEVLTIAIKKVQYFRWKLKVVPILLICAVATSCIYTISK